MAILAAVRHDNIVAFIGYSLEPTLLIVMEFVEGGTLSDYLATLDPLSPPGLKEIVKILLGSALAFQYLHAREPLPILHRDIKSENILVTKTLEPRVADLGEARIMAENATMTMGAFSFSFPRLVLSLFQKSLKSHKLTTTKQLERSSTPRQKCSRDCTMARRPTSSPLPS